MQDFAAIDFETANGRRSSICSVGVVIVREGKIIDRFYSLIQPSPNYYTYWTTEVHGLTHEDTDSQPRFPEVWTQIEGRIAGLPLVAHNCPFDESCLKAAFEVLCKELEAFRSGQSMEAQFRAYRAVMRSWPGSKTGDVCEQRDRSDKLQL